MPPVISAATNFLKVGTPAEPLGLAYTILANWEALVIVNVPVDVTGDPVTVNSAGADNATLVTPDGAGVDHTGKDPPLTVSTCPNVPIPKLFIATDEVAYSTSPAVNVNDDPVPPLNGTNVPANTTAPTLAADGVNPVVPALNDVTLIEAMSEATKLLNVGTPAAPVGPA